MKSSLYRLPLLVLASALLLPATGRAHEVVAQQMVDAAHAFLSALSPESKAKAVFKFDEDERLNWHFVPKERNGLPLKEMTQEQRLLAHALLNAGLSSSGYIKAASIMSLEEVLYGIEGADPARREAVRARRDPEKYFVSIFGEPSMKGTWGWRFEGHHLSLNFAVRDGALLRVTPTFYGSNPGKLLSGPRAGLRILGAEEDLGRALAQSLDAKQWKTALVSETAYKDILTGAEREIKPLTPDGLSDASLNPAQKAALEKLIREHLFRTRPEVAEGIWKEIQQSGPIHFAWAGSREPGQPHYYRIQGKTFLVEYDNTQNNANHIHVVWRDFDGDFGRDLLREHVKTAHQGE